MGVIAAAAFTLTNCTKEFESPVQAESAGVPFVVTAATVETKTVNVDNTWSTAWTDGDQIKVAHALAGETDYVLNGAFSWVGGNDFKGNLAEELVEGANYDWVAVYPYSAAHDDTWSYIEYSKVLTQDGYNSKAHIAGPNCPMYASVANVPAGTTPYFQFKHMSAVIAVKITNVDDEEPVVINSVAFSAGNHAITGKFYVNDILDGAHFSSESEVSVKVNVENGTPLAINGAEEAVVYLVVKPFTAAAGDVLTVWVNDIPKTIVLEEDLTFAAGTYNTTTYEYKSVPAPAYWEAEAVATMDGERIEFELSDIPAWAKNLKDKENTCETIKSAVEAIQQKDFYTAYELLDGVPGFVKAVKTFNGEGKALVKVDYTATDFVGGLVDQIKEINSVDDLRTYLKDVEDSYEVSDMSGMVDEAVGTIDSYIPSSVKNSPIYWGVKEWFENFTLTGLLDAASNNALLSKGLDWIFENEAFRNRILDAVANLVTNLEQEAKDRFDAENETMRQTAEAVAKAEAERQAKVAAKRAAEQEWSATNESNVAKLHKTPWGLYRAVIDSETCKKVFEKLEITMIYDALQMLAAETEALVQYEEGVYNVEVTSSKKILASELL